MRETERNAKMEFADDMQVSAAHKHRRVLLKRDYAAKFRAAINYMLPPPVRPNDLVSLFDSRANYGAIRNWKYGLAIPPQWAIELLARKIHEQVSPGLRHVDSIKVIRSPGRGWNAGDLAAWRERKTRERDAKEKAPD